MIESKHLQLVFRHNLRSRQLAELLPNLIKSGRRHQSGSEGLILFEPFEVGFVEDPGQTHAVLFVELGKAVDRLLFLG